MAYLVLLLAAFILSIIVMPWSIKNPGAWVFTFISFGALIAARTAMRLENDNRAFLMSSLSFMGLWGIAGSLQFPILVRALGNEELNMTIYNSSSSELTLTVMLIIALVGMPLVIAYTAYIYRIFKGNRGQNSNDATMPYGA